MGKVIVVSIFMDNIDENTCIAQRSIVSKYNPRKYDHIQARTECSHAETMDFIMNEYAPKQDVSVVMFLDIDAIPLHYNVLECYVDMAQSGKLVGNAQRSNHIENNQHEFAAPHCVALSLETYEKMGKPSAAPTPRGDVGEEYTYAAEAAGVPVFLYYPKTFELPPVRMPWETDTRPYWPLADGHPNYGVGTTYGEDFIYHSWQIFHADHQHRFQQRCIQEFQKP